MRDARVTPEAVRLETEYAGVGSRMVALLLDGLIQGAGMFFVSVILFSFGDGGPGVVVGLIAVFLLAWVYPVVFEIVWSGQTPGKRWTGIRVVGSDHQPVRASAVVVRNLVRIVDMLPGMYAVGVISVLLTKRAQRLGDLAAGTLVVHEQASSAPGEIILPPNPARERVARSLDVASLSEHDYGVVRQFLRRRGSLPPEVRLSLASDLARRLEPMLGARPAEVDAEIYLEAVADAVRSRSPERR